MLHNSNLRLVPPTKENGQLRRGGDQTLKYDPANTSQSAKLRS